MARRGDETDAEALEILEGIVKGVDFQLAAVSLTPRPPPSLMAPSPSSSIPAASRADISFISESTLPRITPSLASMRWMVGTERPDRSASWRWSIPSRARAARNWAAVIMVQTSVIDFQI